MNWRIKQLTVGVLLLVVAYGIYVRSTHDDGTSVVVKDDGTSVVNVDTPQASVPTSDSPLKKSAAVIDLHGQGLVAVPREIFNQSAVEVLDVSDNQLTGALPAEVRHLSKLRRLDLSNNHFTGLPAELGQLSQLEYLDVSNNPITGLPYELGNLSHLKEFDLRNTNYSAHDLEIIEQTLPSGVIIYK